MFIEKLAAQMVEDKSTLSNAATQALDSSTVMKLPKNIYSYENAKKLHITKLSSGQKRTLTVPLANFKEFSSWCDLPSGALYFTGGNRPLTNSVTCLQPYKEFSVTKQASMIKERYAHSSIYFQGYIYVISGYSEVSIKECERYSLDQESWEAIPPIPEELICTSLIVQESAEVLYVIGGQRKVNFDLIQELRIRSLVWRVLPMKLTSPGCFIPCFKVDDFSCYYVQKNNLFKWDFSRNWSTYVNSFSGAELTSRFSPSYYANHTLYCSTNYKAVNGKELNLMRDGLG